MRIWQQVNEVGGPLAMKMTELLVRFLPYPLLVIIAFPVSFFYWLLDKRGRRSVLSYFDTLGEITGKKYCSFFLYYSFAISIIEKGKSWTGKINLADIEFRDDVGSFDSDLRKGRGVIAIVSHLGSTEELRALSSRVIDSNVGSNVPVLSIVDFDGTEKFSAVLKKLNPDSMLNLMSIRQIDLSSMQRIEDTLEAGGLVIIAGDRVGNRNIVKPFLGRDARFPFGAFYIPALSSVPSYFLFCLRAKDITLDKKRLIYVHKNPACLADNSRRAKQKFSEDTAGYFAGLLERYCIEHPYQWYNFYEFWSDHD